METTIAKLIYVIQKQSNGEDEFTELLSSPICVIHKAINGYNERVAINAEDERGSLFWNGDNNREAYICDTETEQWRKRVH
ncbi:hypothetical protein U1Q18_038819 [Sarracenia purpurea var. burkii]